MNPHRARAHHHHRRQLSRLPIDAADAPKAIAAVLIWFVDVGEHASECRVDPCSCGYSELYQRLLAAGIDP